jgi:galactoside O-acetyltransferase
MKTHNADYLREDDLRAMGVGAAGTNVRVHKSCVLVGLEHMHFGDNVRVDPFGVLTAGGGTLKVGDFVHLSSHLFLSAGAGVAIGDFCALSVGVKVFSRSDDYEGRHMTNPTVPAAFTAPAADGPVAIGRHVVVGAGTVVLPGVEIEDGVAIGAQSLVKAHLPPWGVYAGVPVRLVRARRRDILDQEIRLRQAIAAGEVDPPVTRL